MSSSCRNRFSGFARAAIALGLLGGGSSAIAQQTYFVPMFQVSAEGDTNRRLDPEEERSSEGYKATVEALWRRVTQRSQFELHPTVTYQDYPQFQGTEKLEGGLDLRGDWQTLKGNFSLLGRYTREDTLNAEIGRAAFVDATDPTVPVEDPETAGSGIVTGGITRNTYRLEPSFSYSVTQLTDIEGNLRYTSVKYETDLPKQRVGYDSPYLNFNLVHAYGPRFKVGVGPYAGEFKTDDDSNTTRNYGLNVDVRYRNSEVTRYTLTLNVEKDNIEQPNSSQPEQDVTAWGLQWSGTTKRRIGSIRYAVGRFLEAGSVGTRLRVDQFRLEYNRPISPRLIFDGAVRARHERNIGNDQSVDRDRDNLETQLRALITPTFYVSAGYRFVFLDLSTNTSTAENHGVFIKFGFRGLEPPR